MFDFCCYCLQNSNKVLHYPFGLYTGEMHVLIEIIYIYILVVIEITHLNCDCSTFELSCIFPL